MKHIKPERQNIILEILEEEKKIIASDLSQRLNVSEDTIRRDLNELDDKGLLKRVHSGAVKLGPAIVAFKEREDRNLKEKIKLAKEAVSLIKTDSVVLIDGGTTNFELIKQLPKNKRCTIVTNSIPILNLLKDYPNIKVIGLGGTLFKQSLVMVGYETIKELEAIRPDIYFMGVSNIDDIGATVTTIEECHTKQKMIEVSSETAALVTREKIGTSSNYFITKKDTITYLFVDNQTE